MPEYSPRDRYAPAVVEYMTALDTLIASRGERCPSPLSQDTGARLFPHTAIRERERLHKRTDCRITRQENREHKVREQKHRRYLQRLSQAAVGLQFCTPLTVGEWYTQQQDQDFYGEDIRRLVLAWLPLFTSCRGIYPAYYRDEPLWRLMLRPQGQRRGPPTGWLCQTG